MNTDTRVPFERIDFAVPAQKFRIEFSLIERNSVPFVREFILRLLWISKLSINEMASFMGFTEKEAQTSISQLLDLDEIVVCDDGRLELTSKAKTYFSGSADGSPRIAQIVDRRNSFRFELVSFNYIPRNNDSDDWRFSIKLEPDMENRSRSSNFAKGAFQNNFFNIYNTGDIEKYSKADVEYPDIYKISDVTVQREDFVKISQLLYINVKTGEVERDELEYFEQKDKIIQKITDAMVSHRVGENLAAVANAIDALGANWLLDCISTNGIDVAKFLIGGMTKFSGDKGFERVFGSLLLNDNWDHITSALTLHLKKSSTGNQPEKLIWIAPSTPYWGRSTKIQECLSTLLDFSEKRKKNQTKLAIQLYLPLNNDKNSEKNRWMNEFKDLKECLFAYKEGFMDNNVEILLLTGKFAAVIFHVVTPQNMVPIPLGFMTEDRIVLEEIELAVDTYLKEPLGLNGTKDFGKMTEI